MSFLHPVRTYKHKYTFWGTFRTIAIILIGNFVLAFSYWHLIFPSNHNHPPLSRKKTINAIRLVMEEPRFVRCTVHLAQMIMKHHNWYHCSIILILTNQSKLLNPSSRGKSRENEKRPLLNLSSLARDFRVMQSMMTMVQIKQLKRITNSFLA